MRSCIVAASIGMAAAVAGTGARACDGAPPACGRPVVVFPVVTSEGVRIGTVDAVVGSAPVLRVSRFTGQPLTVLYARPGGAADPVEPGLVLVPLPKVRRLRTQGGYPSGY